MSIIKKLFGRKPNQVPRNKDLGHLAYWDVPFLRGFLDKILGSASKRDVGESSGNVMEVGAFGWGGSSGVKINPNVNQNMQSGLFSTGADYGTWGGGSFPNLWTVYLNMVRNSSGHGAILAIDHDGMKFGQRLSNGTTQGSLRSVWHDGNFNPNSKLSVGAFGLGGYSPNIASGLSEEASGFVCWTSSVPSLGDMQLPTWGAGIFVARSSNNASLIFLDTNSGDLYSAGKGSATWKGLIKYWHERNFNPESKQDTLIAGSNIQIAADGKTISSTNTTYSAMSLAELRTGTATTSRAMTSKNIKDSFAVQTVTGTSITLNLNTTSPNILIAPTANTTLNNPTNAKSGECGDIIIKMGATVRTVAFGTAWKFRGGSIPQALANSMLVISYKVISGTEIICSWENDIK